MFLRCLAAFFAPIFFVSAAETLPFYDVGTAPGAGNFNTDWKGFSKHWQRRQQDFAASRDAEKGAISFLGDSITEKADLKKLFPGMAIANRGISGDTTRGMLYRLENNVLECEPRAVVLLCGTNDMMQPQATSAGTAKDVRGICHSIHARFPKIAVLVLKIMPNVETDRKVVEEFNKAVDKELAGLESVTRVDTYSAFLKADGTINNAAFVDGVHLNEAGYEIYRKTLAPLLPSNK